MKNLRNIVSLRATAVFICKFVTYFQGHTVMRILCILNDFSYFYSTRQLCLYLLARCCSSIGWKVAAQVYVR